ncbi:MAG: MBL fold metallo-hydrolase [Deltaproteobacteria bacterium]|nr:MBL fold metallo-hydrolase [Deltaproteobacteria bacterium]
MSVKTPIPAAVVVPIRKRGETFEVFWVKRAEDLSFQGGFWAFPGGRVEDTDHVGRPDELGARVAAAARELWEETGLRREADLSGFKPLGKTVTPAWAPLRYDATYFLVEVSSEELPDVAHSAGELTHGEWIHPAEAMAAWTRGSRLASTIAMAVMSALIAGIDGVAERMSSILSTMGEGRIWDLVPGIMTSMLRSPTKLPATHTNCYLIGAGELVIIDPGSPYPAELEAFEHALERLASQGRRVREIWLTHHHEDHVSGAARLSSHLGVPIAAHEATARLITPSLAVSRFISEGDVTTFEAQGQIPERRVRAVHTPGHAPGHLCFLEETTGFLVAGDMVAGIGTIVIDPWDGDMADYIASLERMKTLDAQALLPAHGPVITRPARKLDEYIRHRLWREDKIAQALAQKGEATTVQLLPEAYDDVAPEVLGLAERSLVAHLGKLVREGRVRVLTENRYAWAGAG